MSWSLDTLPPELFRYILAYLSPEAASALAQTCRKMNAITHDDKIWQQYFFQRFTYVVRKIDYSNEEYLSSIAQKPFKLPDGYTWQDCFIERSFQDKHIRSLLNEIISTRKHRIHNANLISSTYGLLALDAFKHYFPPSPHASKSISLDSRNLTREYYSLEIARLISRQAGLALLNDMKTRQNIPTEGKALLNALFIIQCFHPDGILLQLTRLHAIGKRLVDDPMFSTLNLTEKCQLILTTMKNESFLPANGSTEYYDISNSFLFSTFHGKPTIPLTLVSIFCALAEECDLIARPLGLPGEVMAQVYQTSASNDTPSVLIISVFDGKIMTLDEINDRLADFLDEPLTHPLPVTSILELISRSARNMINSITQYPTSSLNSYGLYAAVCVLKRLGAGALPFTFDSMMHVLKEHFPMDIHLFDILASPLGTNADDLQRIQEQDANPPIVELKRREDPSPKYFIGQIFQHLQYNYWGVICGWDSSCMASPVWQIRMGISNLTRGATQPFYHILADDSSRRYVAEDNIDTLAFTCIENEENKLAIFRRLCAADSIGKQFERLDMANAKFIPNLELREEYPDDFA
ncbi:unnamed protein product [Adineta ricciae]|uniref:F-box domain-containing protein n=1 Tax=Adineta ricciae TaxID=249248 RepID=A0A815AAS6_ADIRI|nr:unnamed protein product [Adineta ricciae]CAF1254121.1 unnamed protein product [Adineta ricciae]